MELNSNLDKVWAAGMGDTAGVNFVLDQILQEQGSLIGFLPRMRWRKWKYKSEDSKVEGPSNTGRVRASELLEAI